MHLIQHYEIWGSNICVVGGSSRLGSDAGLQMFHSRRFQWTKCLRRQGLKVSPYLPAWPLTMKALPTFEKSRDTHNNWRLDMTSLHTHRYNDDVEDWRSTPTGLLDPWLWRHCLPSKRLATRTTTDAFIQRPYTPIGTTTSSRIEGQLLLACLTLDYEATASLRSVSRHPQKLTPWYSVPTYPSVKRRRRGLKVNP